MRNIMFLSKIELQKLCKKLGISYDGKESSGILRRLIIGKEFTQEEKCTK